MRKTKIFLLMAAIGTSVLSGAAMAGGTDASLVFICHKGFHNDRQDVLRSYKAQLDVPHVTDNIALKPKMMALLGTTAEQYDRSWNRFFFRRGLNLPVSLKNDAEVVQYVASTEDSIGYVSSAPSNPDVEVCGK